jgi:hypothetical protein
VTKPSLQEVDEQYGDGRRTLSDSAAENIIDRADRLADDVYSSRVAREGQIEGNEKDFKVLLACHLIELTEGGEIQSQNQTGGSVSYNTVTGDPLDSLSETRWGRLAETYIRDNQSISIERTY